MANLSNSIHRVGRNRSDKGGYAYYPILVIGAGESGIAMGCRLKEKLGFDQFRIFDRQAGIGGTWWINNYPGVACDVPTLFYSFSFSLSSSWSSVYPEGEEILGYLQAVCNKYQLNDKIQLNTDVTELRWLGDEELWEVHLAHLVPGAGDLSSKDRQQRIKDHGVRSVYLGQETVKAKIVVSGAGGLVEPKPFPDSIPGRGMFEGKVFHSARWDYDVNLTGKDVVVLGTGCSAAQFVPNIAKAPYNANSVTQLMRSPPWVIPQLIPFGKDFWGRLAPRLFGRIPGFARAMRTVIYFYMELDFYTVFPVRPENDKKKKAIESKLIAYMRKKVPVKYHKILTPKYPLGCKRRIIDAGWFESFHDPKVELTTRPLISLQSRGVLLGAEQSDPDAKAVTEKSAADQVQIPADVIILANGFDLATWLHPLKIRGKGDALMQDVWDERGGAQAYMGITMDGFPNFFMIFGPNTATGHSSVILASENAVEYSLKFIKKILDGDVKTAEVKKEAEIAWTREIQEKLNGTVFNSGECQNWYRAANGWNSTAYPYSQTDYSLRCMFPVWSHYNLQYTTKGLIKRTAWRVLPVCLFALAILGTMRIGRGEGGYRSLAATTGVWLQSCRDTVKQGLNFVAGKL